MKKAKPQILPPKKTKERRAPAHLYSKEKPSPFAFKPGHSGNPGGEGRPKDPYRLVSKAMRSRLNTRATDEAAMDAGLEPGASWAQVLGVSLINLAIAGDVHAARTVLEYTDAPLSRTAKLELSGPDGEPLQPPSLNIVVVGGGCGFVTTGRTAWGAGKFVSYLRVSTQRQGRSGLGLEAQRQAVATYLNGGRWTLVQEVVEVESGKRNDRPALANALALCRIHRATLLVAKLDRLARNVAFISALMESGVEFAAVDFPQANRLTVHVLAAVAEHEATMISERTRAALAAAKARGTKLGGLRWQFGTVARQGAVASSTVRRARAAERRADLLPVIRAIWESGAVTLRQVAAALNRQVFQLCEAGCGLRRRCGAWREEKGRIAAWDESENHQRTRKLSNLT